MNFLGNENDKQKTEQASVESGVDAQIVYSPTAGKIIPLNQVDDDVFKDEIVGKGIGVQPELPVVYSPVNGIVKYIPKTKHAVLVLSDDGVEVLIHIGIDTVNLKGQFFESIVQVNDKVQVGDELVKFDLKEIEKLGYSTVIPVVITNTGDYSRVEVTSKESIGVSEILIKVIK